MPSDDAALLWETAQALNRAAAAVSPDAARLPPLLFFTDPERTPEPWRVAARLPAGAGVVFRSFGSETALEAAHRLRAVTADAGVRLLIGADAALAEAVGADGVHLPERLADQAASLRAAHPERLVTAALHADGEAVEGASARVLSPVFAVSGPSDVRLALGPEGFAAIARRQPQPTYALGGVTAANAASLLNTGACGIAAIGAIARAWG